jgi:hypothetical protein
LLRRTPALACGAREERSSQGHANTMLDFLLILLVGWPAIVVTLILAVIGLLRNNYRLLVWAAILAFPFSWYLSGFPSIRSPAFLLPLLLFGSGYLMYRGREMLAWIVAVPFFLAILLLFYVISAQ